MLGALARFVVGHARLVLLGSVIALIGLAVLGAGAFGKLQSGGFNDPGADSTLAAELIEEHFDDDADLVFVVSARGRSVDDASAAAAGSALTAEMDADPALSRVVSYWHTGAPSMVSTDGTQALIVADLVGDAAAVSDRYAGAHDGLDVTVGGPEIIGEDIPEQVGRDLAVAESIAVPIILVLLVLAFGSLVAALLPLAIGMLAILGTFGVLAVIAEITDVSVFAINLTTGLGLALGIDYALLMVSRYREELSGGAPVADAVVRTVETAGRTIVFSGLAVSAALAALLLFPLYFLRSFAYAGIGVVVIAVLGAVIVLPALLTMLGSRVNAGALPWARSITRGGESPVWGRLASQVMRRPMLAAVPVIAVLLVAAAPLLQVTFGTPDDRALPTSAASRQVGDALRDDFASDDTTAIDVVTTSAVAPDELATYAADLSAIPGVDRVESSAGMFVDGAATSEVAAASDAPADGGAPERLAVVMAGDPRSSAAQDLVGDVRAVPPPAAVDVLVSGETAFLVDSLDAIADRLPLAAGLIVLTTFIVLFLFTGSVVQPVRALLSNVLTLGATLGLMVVIFQDGFGSELLGFTPQPLDMAMLVLLFCIVFGLSTDYEVFVMSRIKERHDAGVGVVPATVHGLSHTGRIVSVAAALIAVSFFAFVSSEVSFIQLFGLGTGLAILLDATVVRGILVPASMRLLGVGSWYAPPLLRRLHARVGLAET